MAVTLVPERGDVGLQPLHVDGFPYLISKADDAFARYRDSYPQQVNYLSRRHAHVYLKGGVPFVEDLGSTNGTFVNGKRLADHGVPLDDGDLIAFGGNHFVYQAQVQRTGDGDATATRSMLQPVAAAPDTPAACPAPAHADEDVRTTFVGAADSFLDIFCVDYAAQQVDRGQRRGRGTGRGGHGGARRRAGTPQARTCRAAACGRRRLFGLDDPARTRRAGRWGGALLLLAILAGAAVYWRGAAEREVQALFAAGDHARAAWAADAYPGASSRRCPGAGPRRRGTDARLRTRFCSQAEGR